MINLLFLLLSVRCHCQHHSLNPWIFIDISLFSQQCVHCHCLHQPPLTPEYSVMYPLFLPRAYTAPNAFNPWKFSDISLFSQQCVHCRCLHQPPLTPEYSVIYPLFLHRAYTATAYTNPLNPDAYPGLRKMEAEVTSIVRIPVLRIQIRSDPDFPTRDTAVDIYV